jgi:opacity protein-like surface antigen
VKAQNESQPASSSTSSGIFGIRFMPVFSTFNFHNADNGTVNGEVVMGYGFGAVLGVNFSNNVGLQGEIIYNYLSQKYRDMDLEKTVHLSYINVPLLLSLNTGVDKPVNLNVVFGPQIGLNVGSSVNTSGGNGVDTLNGVFAVKKGDLGFAFGAGLDFALGSATRLSLGYRGVVGLIDISDKSQSITTDQYYILDRAHINTNAGYIGLTFLF